MDRIEKAREFSKMFNAVLIATRTLIRTDELSPTELEGLMDLYTPFNPNAYPYVEGEIFKYEGKLYKVTSVGAVPSQADWLPNALPALYDPINPEGTVGPWEQRYGHNPYMPGDQVIWNGEIYTCVEMTTYTPTDVPAAWTTEEEETPVEPEIPAEAPAWEQRFGGNEYVPGDKITWTDGKIYICVTKTTYSPEQYAPHWELEA